MMDTIEIVAKYLKDNGFDGLYNDDCGCTIDDLAPCGCMPNCEPGYSHPSDGEYDFIIACDKHTGDGCLVCKEFKE